MTRRRHLMLVREGDPPPAPMRSEREILADVSERIAAVEDVLAEWRDWASRRASGTG